MLDIMYDLPEQEEGTVYTIDESVVSGISKACSKCRRPRVPSVSASHRFPNAAVASDCGVFCCATSQITIRVNRFERFSITAQQGTNLATQRGTIGSQQGN